MSEDKVEWIGGLPFHTLPDGVIKMNYEIAKKILHPNTTKETLDEIEYFAGFSGKDARIKAVEEACLLACEVLDMCIEKEKNII
jgi:hypothetical protein